MKQREQIITSIKVGVKLVRKLNNNRTHFIHILTENEDLLILKNHVFQWISGSGGQEAAVSDRFKQNSI